MSDLNKAEFDDLNKIITNTLNSLIKCADKHNIDRDGFVQYFSAIFGTMAEISTFGQYSLSKNKPIKTLADEMMGE